MKRFRLVSFVASGVVIAGILLFVSLPSCKHDPTGLASIDTVCFDSQIFPIISSSCGMTNCHGAGSRRGDFQATSYANIVKLVTPGNAWGSKLYRITSSPDNPNFMPPAPHAPLSLTQRTLIEVWIEQGARDTHCSATNTSTSTTTTTVVSQSDSVCFTQTIYPIIQSSCATTNCHDGSGGEAPYFSDYNSLVRYLTKYQPNSSRLYTVLVSTGESHMPPNSKPQLTSQQIGYFNTWITQGAQDNNCPVSSNCDTTGTISFTNQIWPIIQNNCIGCHASATSGNNNVDLSSYQQINSTAVLVKRNNISLLVGATGRLSGFFAMPPSGSLTTCDVRKLALWVQQGAPNN